jgi:hypothetical protein
MMHSELTAKEVQELLVVDLGLSITAKRGDGFYQGNLVPDYGTDEYAATDQWDVLDYGVLMPRVLEPLPSDRRRAQEYAAERARRF